MEQRNKETKKQRNVKRALVFFAIVLLCTFALAGCDSLTNTNIAKSIQITNIPGAYNGKAAYFAVYNAKSDKVVAITLDKIISSTTFTDDLIDANSLEAFKKKGTCWVTFTIKEPGSGGAILADKIKLNVNIENAVTVLSYLDLNDL